LGTRVFYFVFSVYFTTMSVIDVTRCMKVGYLDYS